MNKNFRRFLSALLCAGMIYTFQPALYAADLVTSGGAEYSYKGEDGHTHSGGSFVKYEYLEPTCTMPKMEVYIFKCSVCVV